MSLANIIQQRVGHQSLLRVIQENFTRSRVKPPLDPQTGYLRASSLPSLCAREEVLCTLNKIDRTDDVDTALNLTFLHGTALHWAIQNELLPSIGAIYGTWKCMDCAALYGQHDPNKRVEDWAVRRPDTCRCGGTEFRYIEHQFVDHNLRLTGHCDGFIVVPGLPGMGVLEAKSIGERGARDVKHAPQIGHIVQAHIYMLFTGFRWGKILYWVKSEPGATCLIEHHIERDEQTIDLIRNLLRSVWSGMATETLPERICTTATCPRAKLCQVRDLCFKAP